LTKGFTVSPSTTHKHTIKSLGGHTMKTLNIINALSKNGYKAIDEDSTSYTFEKGDLVMSWNGDLILQNFESGAVATVINPLVKHQNEEELSYTIKEMEEGTRQ